MSYKVECLAYGETTWASNTLRFDTIETATIYGNDLFMRWLGLKDWRIADADEPPIYTSRDGLLKKFCLNCDDGCVEDQYCDGCNHMLCAHCWAEHNEDAPSHV